MNGIYGFSQTHGIAASGNTKYAKIREKYLGVLHKPDIRDEINTLDRETERAGMIPALSLGIAGTLIFGLAMCMCLVWGHFIIGGIIALPGIAVLSAAYPVYRKISDAKRRENAPIILNLLDRLENNE